MRKRQIAIFGLATVGIVALVVVYFVQQESEGRTFVKAGVTLLAIGALSVILLGLLSGVRYVARRFGP